MELCGATEKTDLFDRRLKIRKGHGSRPSGRDQLQNIRVGHAFDATEIGHDDRDGPPHAGAATDHDASLGNALFQPLNGTCQCGGISFSKFFDWNPVVINPRRRLDRIFLRNEQEGPDRSGRFPCIVDGADQQPIRD